MTASIEPASGASMHSLVPRTESGKGSNSGAVTTNGDRALGVL